MSKNSLNILTLPHSVIFKEKQRKAEMYTHYAQLLTTSTWTFARHSNDFTFSNCFDK